MDSSLSCLEILLGLLLPREHPLVSQPNGVEQARLDAKKVQSVPRQI